MMILRGWSFGEWAIAVVVVLAICGLMVIAARRFEIVPPAWLVQVFWVCVAAFVIVTAIRFVMML